MTAYFSSDHHYGHKRICEFSGRPYDDLIEMREDFIRRHNEVVKPGDQFYALGDFSFLDAEESIKIARRLNGSRFLIWGNHDKSLRKSKEFQAQWQWCKDYAEIKINDIKVVLTHYPMLTWNGAHRGSFNLHGHCHGSLKPDNGARRLDVGVDCFNYTPVAFDEVAELMSKKVFVPVDQHGARDFEKND